MKELLCSFMLLLTPSVFASGYLISDSEDNSASVSSYSSIIEGGSYSSPPLPSQSSQYNEFKDPIDKAFAMSVHKGPISDHQILNCIEELKAEEEELEKGFKKAKKDDQIAYETEKVRLRALQISLGCLRLNWAERILAIATPEAFQRDSALRATVKTCIEELQIFISYRARAVNEPYRSQQKREVRLREIEEELVKREATQKQLEIEKNIWKTLNERISLQREKEKAQMPIKPTSSKVDEIIKNLAQTLQLPDSTIPARNAPHPSAENILAQKKEKFAQMSALLEECKQLDAQCLPKDIFVPASNDNDDDVDDKQGAIKGDAQKALDDYYSSFTGILQAAVEQLPVKESDYYCESISDTQAHYLRLLLSDQLVAHSTASSFIALMAVNAQCIRNRSLYHRFIATEKDLFSEEYNRLHSELEEQKIVLCRLKKLAGHELNAYEKERLKKAETMEKNKKGAHES